MKSYIFTSGILERCYNLIQWDAERRHKKVLSEQDLRISIYDQLTIEHNNFNFCMEEVSCILTALEENGYIEFVSSFGTKGYYMLL